MIDLRRLIEQDLPEVEVLEISTNQARGLIITVKSTKERAVCRKCGQEITNFHGHDDWIELRHLSILGRPVYIRLQPKRYRCWRCDKHPTTTQRLSWYEPKSTCTKAYEDHILLQLVNSTIQDVSRQEQLGYDAVEGVIDRRIETSVEWKQFKRLGVLGLDEIALVKGRSGFVVIVTTLLENGDVMILAVLKDRGRATVEQFLRSIPPRLRLTLHTICTDMYDGYINAAKAALPGKTVVVDRFHVAKQYREAADGLRQQELKRLKRELADKEYQELKGTLWLFRRNSADLSNQERSNLERLFAHSPALKTAYDLREELTAIFNQPLSKEQAIDAIDDWHVRVCNSDLTCFDSFCKTLGKYLDEITNYFLDRHSSGFVEGLNTKIKVLKRRCYGLSNPLKLFQRLVLDLVGWARFGPLRWRRAALQTQAS